jgi:serine/threonine-protein kinase
MASDSIRLARVASSSKSLGEASTVRSLGLPELRSSASVTSLDSHCTSVAPEAGAWSSGVTVWTNQAGRVLAGRYRLSSRITRGSMGTIWSAEHLELGCSVAIKLMDEHGPDDRDSRARFLREARTAAALRSPHVVQVMDYGLDGQTPFLVMELLQGETLLSRLARARRLSRRETATILSQVASALERAHALGVVHRDLSANNVFLVSDAKPVLAKLLDFGIAKSRARSPLGEQVSTVRGMILGTPRYMSPEQAEGLEVDHRTDIWALGVLAFECLLGRAPFEGRTFGGLVLAICSRKLPVPSELGSVPDGFDEWFSRACAREPRARFESVSEAARALRRALRG